MINFVFWWFLKIAYASPADAGLAPASEVARDPVKFVGSIYQIALIIGGFLAFAAIVYGAVRYTLAAGNPSGQTEGRDWIRDAVLGLLLLLGVYLILNIINPNLTVLKLPALDDIKPGNQLVNINIDGGSLENCENVKTCGGGPNQSCPGTCSDGQVCAPFGGRRRCVRAGSAVLCSNKQPQGGCADPRARCINVPIGTVGGLVDNYKCVVK